MCMSSPVDSLSGMPTFSAEVVAAVASHMNTHHVEDNLVIVQAFAEPTATHATLSTLDENSGTWLAVTPTGEHDVTIAWSTSLTERPEIRREIVSLYNRGCAKLGITPRVEGERPASPHTP